MSTQMDRLLLNPQFADPKDPRFSNIRALDFLSVDKPLILSSDPWAGPEISMHPDRGVSSAASVDEAVKALTGKPVTPSTPQPSDQPVAATPLMVTQPKPQVAPQGTFTNTDFPSEGVMLDGGPVDPPRAPPVAQPLIDPWDPKNHVKSMPKGSKVRMGG